MYCFVHVSVRDLVAAHDDVPVSVVDVERSDHELAAALAGGF